MPITDHYARLPLSSILIDRENRQRRELDTKDLILSIRLHGVLNPIIVERGAEGQPHKLTAGERRYRASCELNLPDIPVRFADELSASEALIFELEENIKRKDLSWQDQAKAIERIHALYKELDFNWTQTKTSEALAVTGALVSTYLKVASQMDLNPMVAGAATLNSAYDIIKRREEREEAAKQDFLLFSEPIISETDPPSAFLASLPSAPPGFVIEEPEPPALHDYRIDANPAKNILLESFIHWAPKYSGPAFNLVHCDFPYGVGVFDGPQSGVGRHSSYDDTPEIHFQLLECLLNNFERLTSTSCHMIYWFSMQHYDRIRAMISDLAPYLTIWPNPLIWHKTDNSGIASDHRHGPRHIYENALLISRGRRPLVKMVADIYGAPTDNSLHIHTKPEPMLRYFFSMLIDEFTVFLDPTCGSGSSIRAAESLGAKTVVGMDTDETTVGQARVALRHSRAKRTMSDAVF